MTAICDGRPRIPTLEQVSLLAPVSILEVDIGTLRCRERQCHSRCQEHSLSGAGVLGGCRFAPYFMALGQERESFRPVIDDTSGAFEQVGVVSYRPVRHVARTGSSVYENESHI